MAAEFAEALTNKRLSTLKAQMALRGFQVHDTIAGGWLVARWNLSRYCATLDDLAAFAKQVGAAQ
ncbi:hypothetical protein [Hydrogenophaga sp. T2]|uniref:hypothetical protein n=1 Tax=Hydrogenophaga sp. T2 TaxID=3132823 RepID=UPI003CF48D24